MHDFRYSLWNLFSKPLIGLGQPDNVVELAALFRYCSFSLIPLIIFRVQAICGWNERDQVFYVGNHFREYSKCCFELFIYLWLDIPELGIVGG
jgi:hypothetical protein